ncbi:hypothetical protein D7X33_17770 [Butyricicoccus sp. 1XD8-22]|nr:hypothetical protein D7X33_17770 [Butyricicoccus sp. 1XD8-22]
MTKSFSKYDLLSQEYISQFKRAFSKWIHPDIATLTLEIPYYDYLRGMVFIDDIKKVYEEEAPEEINVSSLLTLLHDDFLYHTQKGVRTHQETASILLNGKLNYLNSSKPKSKVQIKQVQARTFIFDYEEEEEEEELEDVAIIDISMRKSQLQRTEILLYDLSQHMEDTRITVEELMMVLYLDFINRIKKDGNDPKLMKSIIKSFEFHNK